MANRNEIAERMSQLKMTGQDIVRREYISDLRKYTGRDTIIYAANFSPSIPGLPSNLLTIFNK